MTQHLAVVFRSILLSGELKGASRAREFVLKSKLRTPEDSKIIPACNSEG